jgi:hypothetical protein
MKRARLIYAMIMAVVYITATSLSSISLLTCDHHHHIHDHHQTECCHDGCHCDHATLSAVCCDHDHPILGEHHTDYIASNQRSDSSLSQALTILLSPTTLAEQFSYETRLEQPSTQQRPGDEAVPLLAAIHQSKALRAPPTLV